MRRQEANLKPDRCQGWLWRVLALAGILSLSLGDIPSRAETFDPTWSRELNTAEKNNEICRIIVDAFFNPAVSHLMTLQDQSDYLQGLMESVTDNGFKTFNFEFMFYSAGAIPMHVLWSSENAMELSGQTIFSFTGKRVYCLSGINCPAPHFTHQDKIWICFMERTTVLQELKAKKYRIVSPYQSNRGLSEDEDPMERELLKKTGLLGTLTHERSFKLAAGPAAFEVQESDQDVSNSTNVILSSESVTDIQLLWMHRKDLIETGKVAQEVNLVAKLNSDLGRTIHRCLVDQRKDLISVKSSKAD